MKKNILVAYYTQPGQLKAIADLMYGIREMWTLAGKDQKVFTASRGCHWDIPFIDKTNSQSIDEYLPISKPIEGLL